MTESPKQPKSAWISLRVNFYEENQHNLIGDGQGVRTSAAVVEQRLRAQSRATTVAIGHGHAVVVTTAERPVAGGRGWTAAPMRHGVSVVRDGRRHTLGLLFHDAT